MIYLTIYLVGSVIAIGLAIKLIYDDWYNGHDIEIIPTFISICAVSIISWLYVSYLICHTLLDIAKIKRFFTIKGKGKK